jgi:hypothetical protein
MTVFCPSTFIPKALIGRIGFCAVARNSHFGNRLSLKQYLAANHIVVAPYGGVQTIPDKQLAAVGAKRNSCIRIPYFGVALQCLPGTELVLTLTSGMIPAIKGIAKHALQRHLKSCSRFISWRHGIRGWTVIRLTCGCVKPCD